MSLEVRRGPTPKGLPSPPNDQAATTLARQADSIAAEAVDTVINLDLNELHQPRMVDHGSHARSWCMECLPLQGNGPAGEIAANPPRSP